MVVVRSPWRVLLLLLQWILVVARTRDALGFTEEPPERAAKPDAFCSWIIRAHPQGARKDGHSEFRLRVEGDPDHYQPGSTYRVTLYATSPAYFRGFTLIALKEWRNGEKEEDYAGNFQASVLTKGLNGAKLVSTDVFRRLDDPL